MAEKIRVSVVGCCLVDRLYNNISFSDPGFVPFLSKKQGDGGLAPGHLVFKEEFERFGKAGLSEILKTITRGREPDKVNIGGPGVVPLIHLRQMQNAENCVCCFYGCGGKDEDGEFIVATLKQMDLPLENYRLKDNVTPSTIVLSDPDFDEGNGERAFINSIGAAWDYSPEELDDRFFQSDIVVFGGTGLVPRIHDDLTGLLAKAKANGCITMVNTVFDFRNEKANPHKKWPLGRSDESYRNIDLLMVDYAEALRLSGKNSVEEAMQFFRSLGTGAVIVTNGSRNIRLFARAGGVFEPLDETEMPVSKAISRELEQDFPGDTTGCGDNFVGGVISSVVTRLLQGTGKPDLTEASAWGIVSGGYSCFYVGGTYHEQYPGEKREKILPYYEQYKSQLQHGR
jgi:sugar/nucleoside kinase (ribokinase family)